VTSVKLGTTAPTLSEERDQNLKVKGHGSTNDVGITGYNSSNAWAWQLYGSVSASEYGFLNGNWSSWDLRKSLNGNLYMNNSTTYYLNSSSTSNLSALVVAASASFNSGVRINNDLAMNQDGSGAYTIIYGATNANAAAYFGSGSNYYDANNHYFRSYNGAASTFTIDASGNCTATGNVTAYSDVRLKDDIRTIPLALDKVENMRGVYFKKKTSEDPKYSKYIQGSGVIAQELEEVAPELVMTDEDGYKSVAYANITGYLIEAIKELSEKVTALEARL
jgi:hypothetical protein